MSTDGQQEIPRSRAGVRSNFQKQLNRLAEHQDNVHWATITGGRVDFYSPDGPVARVHDFVAAGKPFTREEHATDFQDIAANGGAVGDFEITQIQGDFLAMLERAYRDRHKSSIRSRMHAAARHRGHGHEAGVLKLGLQGYLEWVDKLAKERSNRGR